MKNTPIVIAIFVTTFFKGIAIVRGIPPPRITSVEGDEMIVESKSIILIVCEATEPIEWALPTLSDHFENEPHPKSEIHERANSTTRYISGATDGYVYRSSLEVQDAHYLDTGYFTCHHAGADPEDTGEEARVYVYVEDQEHLLVVRDDEDITVLAHQSKREVIPCKPTHPRIKVILDGNGNENNIDEAPESKPWSYDPREGFIVGEAELTLQNLYRCLAKSPDTNKIQELRIHLEVRAATASAPKPHIDSSNAAYVVINSSFMLNCSAQVELGTNVHMTWQVPVGVIDDRRIAVENASFYIHEVGMMRKRIAHKVLRVRNASKIDEGTYSCIASDHTQKTGSAKTFVKVHDKNISFVNISNYGLIFEIERKVNETVKWVVQFAANPFPEIIWYKSGEQLYNKSQKIIIKKEQKTTSLEILNVTAADSGSYELIIKTSEQQDSRNFTLKVKDKPLVTAPEKITVKMDSPFNFKCDINSYPESNEELVFFRPCLPQINCNNETWSLVFSSNNSKTFKASPNEEKIFKTDRQTISVTGRARIGGHYRCGACNSFGCRCSREIKGVNKLPSLILFELNELNVDTNTMDLKTSLNRAPITGEEFAITCAVSLYRFSSRLEWRRILSNGTRVPLNQTVPTNELEISRKATNYSYTETLRWPLISPSADGVYECLSPENKSTSFELRVKPRMAPQIKNKSDETVAIFQFDELYLFCEATGMPLPTVEWFKDEQPVTNMSSSAKKEETLQSVFHRKAMKTADSGTYTCKFTNINGTEQVNFLVTVMDQPLSIAVKSGIVIISIVVIILLSLLIHKIRQDKKRKAFFHAHQLDMFDKGNPESINPDLPVDEQTELLPYDRKWEFPSDKLKLGKQLGAGAFGRVVKADAIGILNSEPITTVAVKMVRSQGNMLGLKALMSELKIMVHMGSHLNVVNLLGACTKNIAKGELLVIVEYCRYGNIQNYLIKHRSSFINEVDHRGMVVASPEGLIGAESQLTVGTPRSPKHFDMADYDEAHAVATGITFLPDSRDVTTQMQTNESFDSAGKQTLTSSPSKASDNGTQAPWRSNYRGDYRDEPEKPICTRDLICWAFQIARGMEYLARRKILHGDLAARNVLLADNNIVKIADFGLAREVYRSGNYKKKGEGPLPVKWMAIESIIDRVFSTQSDVWSYGIVLWELFSLGKTPYPGMEADEYFFIKVKQGYRMNQPKYAPSDVGAVMRECWLQDPVARPSFTDLADRLGMLLETSIRIHYAQLNEEYDRLNDNAGSDYLGMMATMDYANMGSRTPVPERRQYVNIPQNDYSTTESECLQMERMRSKGVSDQRPDGEASYLFMSSPITSPQQTPTITNSPGERHFDFNLPPKQRQIEETAADSVELCPILHSPDNVSPKEQTIPAKFANAYSSPEYQNHPAISHSYRPSAEHYAMPRVLSPTCDPIYANVADHLKESVEPVYAVPTNNAKVA